MEETKPKRSTSIHRWIRRGFLAPFYIATRGLATVDLRLTKEPRRRAVARH